MGEFDEHLHGAATPQSASRLAAASAVADRGRIGVGRPDWSRHSAASSFAVLKVMTRWARLCPNQMARAQV
jgi:hypothetical protein